MFFTFVLTMMTMITIMTIMTMMTMTIKNENDDAMASLAKEPSGYSQ